MNKQQAQDIIKNTFESSFDINSFTGFIKNLLNRIDDASFTYQGNYIPDAYKQYIKKLERIGKFSDGENSIDILVITLHKETSLERARTMQRNFIAWYLNGSRGSVMKDAALAAFVSPDEEDWRFSLVKMDYKFEQTKTGRMKVKEEFTPARRWSFLVGANEKSHTAQSRLVNILVNDEQAPTLKEIENAFDIETVTKEFFLGYRGLFLRTKVELDRVVKNDPKIKADFEAKGVDTVNFAKKLLGQIVFLYFLQKKGWFGVGRDNDWGTGSKHFLRELFDKKHSDYNNFFNDILEPLFYEALRSGKDREHIDYYYSRFNCKIPFLNGGLFDPIGSYDWVHTDIIIPDSLFSNKVKTKEGDEGDGILDIFDRFNFTVKEDEPLEKEVAIDPELLGKAYEKFNAIRPDNFEEYKKALKSGKKGEESKFNKKFGVYYTPREIVHYMCQQSLLNYLETELDKKANKEDIETLLHIGEHVSENEEIALIKEKNIKEGKQKTSDYKLKLPESIRKNAVLIDQKLADITVCDPAVGSGAFPVGMMSEIVRTRNVLSTFVQGTSRTLYEFKRRCIEQSLYGVDIDPGAVEIAKLRLWLSLVVDEDDIKNIKPLPNLDYKVVCGNSLLGVEKNLFNDKLFSELEQIKPNYFNETNPTEKQEYKRQIDELISKITDGHKEFDFEVFFSEVFHNKGGFDIVLGNPPYISAVQDSKDDKNLRKIYRERYPILKGAFDIYTIFLLKGVELTTISGSFAWIVPNKLMVTKYAEEVLQHLKRNGLYTVVSVSSVEVFENVSVYPIIIVGNKLVKTFKRFKANQLNDLSSNNLKPETKVKQHPTFKDFGIKVCSGTTGFQAQQILQYISENKTKHSMPFVVSGSIDPYFIRFDSIRYMKHKFKRAFITKGAGIASTKWAFWQNEKIVIAGMTKKIEAIYFTEPLALGVGVYAIPSYGTYHPKVLLAVLNSKYLSYYLNTKFRDKHLAGGYLAINKSTIEQLPLVKIDEYKQKDIIMLVDRILSLTQTDGYLQNSAKQTKVKELEKQIDQMVYKLYGLTKEEIAIVEKS